MRIKMLDPNSRFFQFIKERVTEEEFRELLSVYVHSRKYQRYSVYWDKINRTPEERNENYELAREAQHRAQEERKAAREKQALKGKIKQEQ